MREDGPARLRIDGDQQLASTYVGLARTYLGALKASMKQCQLKQLSRVIPIDGGITITVSSVFGQDTIAIDVPLSSVAANEQVTSLVPTPATPPRYFYRITGIQAASALDSSGLTLVQTTAGIVGVQQTAAARIASVLQSVRKLLSVGRLDVTERLCNAFFGADCALFCDQGFAVDAAKITATGFDPQAVFPSFLQAFDHSAAPNPTIGAPAGTTYYAEQAVGRLDRRYARVITGHTDFIRTIGVPPNGSFLVDDTTDTLISVDRLTYRRNFSGWQLTTASVSAPVLLSGHAYAAGGPTPVTGVDSTTTAFQSAYAESYGTQIIVGQYPFTMTIVQDSDGSPRSAVTIAQGAYQAIVADYVTARYLDAAGNNVAAYRSGRLSANAQVAGQTFAFDAVIGAAVAQDTGSIGHATSGAVAFNIANYSGDATNYLTRDITLTEYAFYQPLPVYAEDWVGPPVKWSDVGCIYDPASGAFAYVKFSNAFLFQILRGQYLSASAPQPDVLASALALVTELFNTGISPSLFLAADPAQLVLVI